MSKLVSAVITTHNRVDLLKRAIASVLNQTYSNVECVVVDDASTDDTNVYCESLPINYIRISPDERRGGNYARNKGILAAKGEYVAFLDDDDYWHTNKIEEQMNLVREKNAKVVYCGERLEFVDSDGVRCEDLLPVKWMNGDISRKILYNICTTTSCLLVEKKLLEDIGLFDESISFWQEYELSIRLAQKVEFYSVNSPLITYRINKRDPLRLTNKFFKWKDSVRMIKEKHNNLFSTLTFAERIKAYTLYVMDAKLRSKNSGLTFYWLYYSMISIPLRFFRKLSNLNN
ncbi:MAG: glycosyltransferase family 2 protein [Bacteroidales bacterium]|nr:glycosyltransferase family 2 protein [Candidatus Physcocola equi]